MAEPAYHRMIYDTILENEVLRDPNCLAIFTYCLVKACHEPKKLNWSLQEHDLDGGQLVASLRAIAEHYRMTHSVAKTAMRKLVVADILSCLPILARESIAQNVAQKKGRNIAQNDSPKRRPVGLMITICNASKYQAFRFKADGPFDPKRSPKKSHGASPKTLPTELDKTLIPSPSSDSLTPREPVFTDRQIENPMENSESPPSRTGAHTRVRAGSSDDDLFAGGERQMKPRPGMAFNGAVIRMSQQRFDQFVADYPEITNHRAELLALDPWIASLDKAKREGWEGILASTMAKRINHSPAKNGNGHEEDDWPDKTKPRPGGMPWDASALPAGNWGGIKD